MPRAFGLTICALSGALLACGSGSVEPITALPRRLTVGEQKLIATGNRFAFDFFREIVRRGESDSNVFVSPLSADMALGMTYNGARGETQAAMARTLGLDQLTVQDANQSFRSLIDLLRGLDPEVDFRLANSIWYRLGFIVPRPEFLDVNRQYFDAEVKGLDFTSPQAVTTINHWADDHTNGKIPKIVDGIDPTLVMFLINAIYFKGSWVHQFDKSLTRDQPFHPRTGAQRSVPTMRHAEAVALGLYQGPGYDVVDLPYGGGAFSMTIVLPAEGRDVDSVVAGLTPEVWGGIVDGLRDGDAIVSMPKFQLAWGDTLNDALTALGMGMAFIPGEADLSGIAGDPGSLYISFVQQNTFVDVNEEGTEAAAVTTVGVGVVSAPQVREIRIDRPFVFLIRERFSGTVLFMGRIVNPS
jgi:serpin B